MNGSWQSLAQKLIGLAHPDSSSNFNRRATKGMAESKSHWNSIDDIEWNLGLNTDDYFRRRRDPLFTTAASKVR